MASSGAIAGMKAAAVRKKERERVLAIIDAELAVVETRESSAYEQGARDALRRVRAEIAG